MSVGDMASSSPAPRPVRRNKTFDLLRIAFALFVLLSHAFELTDGNRSRELLTHFAHSRLSLGEVGVDGFFLLSGFLIVQSWAADPRLGDFLIKRVLRIVPGYVVAVVLSVVVVGLLAPTGPHFFTRYWLSRSFYLPPIAMLSFPLGPPVFPGEPQHAINGSLWTISYEFRCYLLVALLGFCRVIRKPFAWAGLTAFCLLAFGSYRLHTLLTWHSHHLLLGDTFFTFRLGSVFLVGGCFFLFRERIPFRPALALLAGALLLLCQLRPSTAEPGIEIFGGYLLFYLGQLRDFSPPLLRRLPDISYGLYLYGWPVQCLWIYFLHGSPWVTFVMSSLICAALGWLSWIFVERPALKLKPHPTARLAPR